MLHSVKMPDRKSQVVFEYISARILSDLECLEALTNIQHLLHFECKLKVVFPRTEYIDNDMT